MARISTRVSSIAESATVAISDRARQMKAEGRDVISFGAGEPDFPTPQHIVEAAVAACRDPVNHHYTANAGLTELREAIAQVTLRDSDVSVLPEQVVVTNGGKQAVYLTMAALLDPGDEVLIPAPYWVTYPEAASLSGGVAVPIPTDESSGFKLSVAQLEEAITARTKLLVFVSPSNPTGAVYSPEEVRQIGRVAGEHGIWVLTDEIYQQLIYGDAAFSSVATAPELEDRWVIVNGVAKTYAMTGWRVGWLAGPADVAAAAAKHQTHLSSNVANVSQRAALAGLTGPSRPVEEMRAAFDRRRRMMLEYLADIPGVTCIEPKGAFYVFPGFHNFLARFGSTIDLAAHILEVAEVAVVPGEAFGAPGHIRLSYALSDEDLQKGMARLRAALAEVEDSGYTVGHGG
jgi:aspartate aminotransferase